jgi:hypothetical protein
VDAPNDLAINVADSDDIQRKLPEVSKRVDAAQIAYEDARAALETAQDRANSARTSLERWSHLFASLRAMIPDPAASDEDEEPERGVVPEAFMREGDPNSVDLVVSIIDSGGREMRTREVREIAAPRGLADDTVSWALWKASTLNRIRKIKRGRYAPLEVASEQSELAVSSNGTAPDEAPQPAPDAGVQTQ